MSTHAAFAALQRSQAKVVARSILRWLTTKMSFFCQACWEKRQRREKKFLAAYAVVVAILILIVIFVPGDKKRACRGTGETFFCYLGR